MSNMFFNIIKGRRSIYAIGKEKIVHNDKIVNIVKEAHKYVPAAFNAQTSRAVVLFDQNHEKFWDITKEALRKVVPEDSFAPTEEKIDSFKAGYGTVLYFEDLNVVKALQEKFPLYKDNFPIWSQQGAGMVQFVIWTALEEEGLGVTLQHYSELVEQQVKQQWNVPDNYKFVAQMPFGKPLAPAGDKDFPDLDELVKSY
ncbi:nitroreductase family protein [Clostridium oryzae]|uniref:Nitroreductase family protein n=1 Tax=Clostridium oryzae TaxID=1450648 RepID=A0A1V4IMW9_9CLOT|nr:nitroreductase family protein [Clostridium oryzae]OPJ60837.1 nitroreductase family protein [Clostridium oryzae]